MLAEDDLRIITISGISGTNISWPMFESKSRNIGQHECPRRGAAWSPIGA